MCSFISITLLQSCQNPKPVKKFRNLVMIDRFASTRGSHRPGKEVTCHRFPALSFKSHFSHVDFVYTTTLARHRHVLSAIPGPSAHGIVSTFAAMHAGRKY